MYEFMNNYYHSSLYSTESRSRDRCLSQQKCCDSILTFKVCVYPMMDIFVTGCMSFPILQSCEPGCQLIGDLCRTIIGCVMALFKNKIITCIKSSRVYCTVNVLSIKIDHDSLLPHVLQFIIHNFSHLIPYNSCY